MSHIVLKNVFKAYQKNHFVIRDLNLEIRDDEFLVLVGPSGCGKTTLLRMIAGLEEITKGELYIDDVYQNDKDPSMRKLSFVFQDYALLPSLTVFENIKFGLIDTQLSALEKHRLVEQMAIKMSLYDRLGSYPHQLSGGQRQRVALARALVDGKKLIMFDEPLSNLDAVLRASMRKEITLLKNNFNITGVYVTHDQIEAMSMADRIALMIDGMIQQVGTPDEMFNNPRKLSVATFIGSPEINVIKAKYTGKYLIFNQEKIVVDMLTQQALQSYENQMIYFTIRPQHIRIYHQPIKGGLLGHIDIKENLGPETLLHISVSGQIIRVIVKDGDAYQDDVYLDLCGNYYLFNLDEERIDVKRGI